MNGIINMHNLEYNDQIPPVNLKKLWQSCPIFLETPSSSSQTGLQENGKLEEPTTGRCGGR